MAHKLVLGFSCDNVSNLTVIAPLVDSPGLCWYQNGQIESKTGSSAHRGSFTGSTTSSSCFGKMRRQVIINNCLTDGVRVYHHNNRPPSCDKHRFPRQLSPIPMFEATRLNTWPPAAFSNALCSVLITTPLNHHTVGRSLFHHYIGSHNLLGSLHDNIEHIIGFWNVAFHVSFSFFWSSFQECP